VLWEPANGVAAPALPSQVTALAIPQLSATLGAIADRFFDEPSKSVSVAAVTGTNGKTTSTYVIAQAFAKLGREAAYAGTLGYGRVGAIKSGTHTTPDAVTVHRQLAELRAAGCQHLGIEVSSHALDQHRVSGVRFHSALFTNLTHDHLDYHGTFAAYGAAKARLFDWPGLRHAVFNIDDAFGSTLAFERHHDALVTAVSSTRAPDVSGPRMQALFAERVTATSGGLQINVNGSWGAALLRSRFIGAFNVDNLLGALAVLLGYEVPLAAAIEALEHCAPPPGRMETFGAPGLPLVVVDYAHTPDALEKALVATRQHCQGKLICVFGCGGDRDANKRPLMGAIAERLADRVIVTDDNPRTEDGDAIVADILNGMKSADSVLIERDRAVAIERAIAEAGASDAVLIAGKGHEDYQIVGLVSRYFSDRDVVNAVLRRRS
jgi:UDP-N-acetylmuramoyl-L-alanyl-D-glutamate--2,6-diaminopimelate ligase